MDKIKIMHNFSVVIPTYNSSRYLKECIYALKSSTLLDEIIVCDDGSEYQELENIKNIIQKASKHFSFEIIFLENKKNIGAFKNKYRLIKAAKNDWVYQIDSDNIAFPKIDKVISEIIRDHNSQLLIYYPSKLIQFWKYKRTAAFLSRIQKKYIVKFSRDFKYFDIENTKRAVEEFLNYDTTSDKTVGSPELKSKFLIDKHIYWVLNCGNFIVNKKQFLNAMKPGLDFSREILSMDAVAFSYLWLKNKGTIVLHPRLSHFHRKRYTSISYTTKDSSKISRDFFTKKIMLLTGSDLERKESNS